MEDRYINMEEDPEQDACLYRCEVCGNPLVIYEGTILACEICDWDW